MIWTRINACSHTWVSQSVAVVVAFVAVAVAVVFESELSNYVALE